MTATAIASGVAVDRAIAALNRLWRRDTLAVLALVELAADSRYPLSPGQQDTLIRAGLLGRDGQIPALVRQALARSISGEGIHIVLHPPPGHEGWQ